MSKRKTTLSLEDRKAVDIVLDHAAHAGSSSVTRLTTDVPPARITAVTRLLHVLSHMPAIDPPRDLVARTMARIDRDIASRSAAHSHIAVPATTHLH
jgi:hypothetical protein